MTTTPTLSRRLRSRHIQFIALGGAIGSGLFYGSTATISLAGPSVLLGYIIGGCLMFIIMRALGEMATDDPESGSFSEYAHHYVGPFAGFLVGWTYWFSWIVVDMAELAAFGVYIHYWFPGVPAWSSALFALCLLMSLNLVSAHSFGEAEFWFALVKVTAIIAVIICGAIILSAHLDTHSHVSNLWRYGGFAPHGLYGLMLALPLVMFSFGGTELVGITAGEALDPTVSIPKAVNQVIWRILLFYVGAIAFIVMLVPWPEIGVKASPFVIAFSSVGLPGASNILNFVVITAALSAFNSGLYSTGRMLLTLSQNHQAPHVFTKISARGHVPVNGIMFSALVLSIGVVVEIVVPERAFVYLASVATMSLLFTWTMILVTQYRFRRIRRAEGTENELGFKLFYWPYSSALGFLLLAGVVVIMTLQSSTRLALYIAPVWFGALGAGYTTFVKGRVAPPPASTEPVSPRSGAE